MSHQDYYKSRYWAGSNEWSPAEVTQIDPRLARLFRRHLQTADTLLDVGCGDGGHYGSFVRSLVAQHYGIDLSLAALNHAKRRRIIGSQGNLDKAIPLVNHSVDVAACIEVFEHLFDPAALTREIWRVLKSDGRLIASVPNIAHFSHRLRLVGGKFVAGGSPQSADTPWIDPHIRFFTRRSFRNMLQTTGFRPVTMIGIGAGILTGFPVLSVILGRLLGKRRLQRTSNALEGLARLYPPLFAGHFVAVCRKMTTSQNPQTYTTNA